jgi:hypothetical protein
LFTEAADSEKMQLREKEWTPANPEHLAQDSCGVKEWKE